MSGWGRLWFDLNAESVTYINRKEKKSAKMKEELSLPFGGYVDSDECQTPTEGRAFYLVKKHYIKRKDKKSAKDSLDRLSALLRQIPIRESYLQCV